MANIILPTFEALSDEVLTHCLQSGTQNQNEASNSLIWQHATKKKPFCLAVVELAAYLAVCHFNDGAMSICSVLHELGIYPGLHCIRACKQKKWTVTDSTILAARDPKVPEGGENSSAISKKATMAP